MSTQETHKQYQVIIVGAGIAGLGAANFLYNNGLSDILILEAKEKVGGRIDTRRFGNSASHIELGAQWIHGEENDFCKLLKASGHLHHKTSWEGKGEFFLPNGEKSDESVVTEVLEWVENTIGYVEDTFSIEEFQNNPLKHTSGNSLMSMGHFLKDRFLKYLENLGIQAGSEEYELRMAVFQWGMSFQRIDNSCNQMTDLSLFRWPEFQINPGELYNNFKEGAGSFVDNVLVAPLPQNSIRCNAPVANICWKDESVKVQLRNGDIQSAHCVLITCSIGVLKKSQDTLFTPKLPQGLQDAINATGFGPIAKIFLKWDKPWWPEKVEGFQFLWPIKFINCCDDETDLFEEEVLRQRWPKSITGFDPVVDNPNVLLGWLGGPEAKFVEGLSEEEVGKGCAKILRDFTGYPLPEPDEVAVSKWNNDEFFGGAYCYRATEGDQVQGDITVILSKPVMKLDSQGNEIPVIILAGEALSKTHYSTLHGAYESGVNQAAKIIDYFRNIEKDRSAFTNTRNTHDLPNLQHKQSQEIQRELSRYQETISKDNCKLEEIGQLVCQFSKHVNVTT